MKRKIRTYLSVVLLLCLAVQFTPIASMHSHEENHGTCEHIELDQQDHVSDSDFSFESSDDCDLCDLLLALNDEHHSFDQTTELTFHHYNRSESLIVRDFATEDLSNTIRGRAPPAV